MSLQTITTPPEMDRIYKSYADTALPFLRQRFEKNPRDAEARNLIGRIEKTLAAGVDWGKDFRRFALVGNGECRNIVAAGVEAREQSDGEVAIRNFARGDSAGFPTESAAPAKASEAGVASILGSELQSALIHGSFKGD